MISFQSRGGTILNPIALEKIVASRRKNKPIVVVSLEDDSIHIKYKERNKKVEMASRFCYLCCDNVLLLPQSSDLIVDSQITDVYCYQLMDSNHRVVGISVAVDGEIKNVILIAGKRPFWKINPVVR